MIAVDGIETGPDGFLRDRAASPFEPTATRVAGVYVAGAPTMGLGTVGGDVIAMIEPSEPLPPDLVNRPAAVDVGGIAHFLLPEVGSAPPAPRYGDVALKALAADRGGRVQGVRLALSYK